MLLVKKERKGKGLLCLISIAVLIAVISAGCKNKPTQTNDFAGFDESVSPVDKTKDFTQFLGRTIRSKSSIGNTSGMAYFWAKFTDDGISYGAGTEASGNFSQTTFLAKSALNDKVAKFDGKAGSDGVVQEGTITFTDDGTSITSITVKFTKGTSYQGQTIECQFVNE